VATYGVKDLPGQVTNSAKTGQDWSKMTKIKITTQNFLTADAKHGKCVNDLARAQATVNFDVEFHRNLTLRLGHERLFTFFDETEFFPLFFPSKFSILMQNTVLPNIVCTPKR
jgi:hypothetical protein